MHPITAPDLDHQPLPIELLQPLAGNFCSDGPNRNKQSVCHIDADNDFDAIQSWLSEFSDSPNTFRYYRKEVERLLLWSMRHLNKSLAELTRTDFVDYQAFLTDPQPSRYWCGPRAPRDSGRWHPFEKGLSANSQKQALIAINALFSYLVDAGYLMGNPLSLIRRRNRRINDEDRKVAVERFLDQESWQYLKDYIANLPKNTSQEANTYERIRFLFHLLYLLAPRVSEVSSHSMNSFREHRGRWWWFVIGKGFKKAKVPVSDEMLDALMRYRRFLGLEALPDENDQSPLLRSIKGTSAVTSSTVYRIVKSVVTDAAEQWMPDDPIRAKKLKRASTHWFRHTSITQQDDSGISLKYLSRNARHEKLETTAIYQHVEDDRWHDESQKHRF